MSKASLFLHQPRRGDFIEKNAFYLPTKGVFFCVRAHKSAPKQRKKAQKCTIDSILWHTNDCRVSGLKSYVLICILLTIFYAKDCVDHASVSYKKSITRQCICLPSEGFPCQFDSVEKSCGTFTVRIGLIPFQSAPVKPGEICFCFFFCDTGQNAVICFPEFFEIYGAKSKCFCNYIRCFSGPWQVTGVYLFNVKVALRNLYTCFFHLINTERGQTCFAPTA